MRNNTQSLRDTNRNQPQQASSNPKLPTQVCTSSNAGRTQVGDPASKTIEQPIDVLSFVGFKL